MKLVGIEGHVWELSILQSDEHAESENDITPLNIKNVQAIKNKGWFRGIVRTLANHGVKSKARAIIETTVNGLPHQMSYDIYHNSRGFFCNVQSERVFLEKLVTQ